MPVYYSPLAQVKRRIKNSTRGIAISQALMIIFNLILNILLITAAVAIYGTSTPGYTFNDFILDYVTANLYQMLFLLPTLVIALAVIIFFILMAIGFRSLGKTLETSQIRTKLQQTSDLDKPLDLSSNPGSTFRRAGDLWIIGIIINFVSGIILNFIETFTTALISDILDIIFVTITAFGYFFVVVAFRKLKKIGTFPRDMKHVLFFAQMGLVVGNILLLVGYNIFFDNGFIIFILAEVLVIASSIFYIIGLFRLGKDTQDIVDTAVPTYPAAPYAPTQQIYYQQQPASFPDSSVEEGPRDTKFCSYCGNKIQLTDKFCRECGRNIADQ